MSISFFWTKSDSQMSETPSVAGYILKELPMTTKLTTSPGGGDSERLKKTGWKYGAGAGLLISMGLPLFNNIGVSFSRFIIFKFRNYFLLCNISLCVTLCYHNL